jgi:hypothetical protein
MGISAGLPIRHGFTLGYPHSSYSKFIPIRNIFSLGQQHFTVQYQFSRTCHLLYFILHTNYFVWDPQVILCLLFTPEPVPPCLPPFLLHSLSPLLPRRRGATDGEPGDNARAQGRPGPPSSAALHPAPIFPASTSLALGGTPPCAGS